MKDQLWIRLESFCETDCHKADITSWKDKAIKNYDELVEWMERNKEMWQLVRVDVSTIVNTNFPVKETINVRNVYYVFN